MRLSVTYWHTSKNRSQNYFSMRSIIHKIKSDVDLETTMNYIQIITIEKNIEKQKKNKNS